MGFLVIQHEKYVPLPCLSASAGLKIYLSKGTMRLRYGDLSIESHPPLIVPVEMPPLPEMTLDFDVCVPYKDRCSGDLYL